MKALESASRLAELLPKTVPDFIAAFEALDKLKSHMKRHVAVRAHIHFGCLDLAILVGDSHNSMPAAFGDLLNEYRTSSTDNSLLHIALGLMNRQRVKPSDMSIVANFKELVIDCGDEDGEGTPWEMSDVLERILGLGYEWCNQYFINRLVMSNLANCLSECWANVSYMAGSGVHASDDSTSAATMTSTRAALECIMHCNKSLIEEKADGLDQVIANGAQSWSMTPIAATLKFARSVLGLVPPSMRSEVPGMFTGAVSCEALAEILTFLHKVDEPAFSHAQ